MAAVTNRSCATTASSEPQALELQVRGVDGRLLAEGLQTDARCTVAELAAHLLKCAPPAPRAEYHLVLGTKVLPAGAQLGDVLTNGVEVTAVVVPSLAGEFHWKESETRGVTLCLNADRSARCVDERKAGRSSFFNTATGWWQVLPNGTDGDSSVKVQLIQLVGPLGEFRVEQELELKPVNDEDLEVVKLQIQLGGFQIDESMVFGRPGRVFSRF